MAWYAVRCLFRVGWADQVTETAREGVTAYEERITLWEASTGEQAIALAEQEAQEYAAVGRGQDAYLGLAQSFELLDEPGHGAEVFSLIRESRLDPNTYLDCFFDTGHERQESFRPADPLRKRRRTASARATTHPSETGKGSRALVVRLSSGEQSVTPTVTTRSRPW